MTCFSSSPSSSFFLDWVHYHQFLALTSRPVSSSPYHDDDDDDARVLDNGSDVVRSGVVKDWSDLDAEEGGEREDEDEEILAIPYQEVLYHPEPVHISIFDLSI